MTVERHYCDYFHVLGCEANYDRAIPWISKIEINVNVLLESYGEELTLQTLLAQLAKSTDVTFHSWQKFMLAKVSLLSISQQTAKPSFALRLPTLLLHSHTKHKQVRARNSFTIASRLHLDRANLKINLHHIGFLSTSRLNAASVVFNCDSFNFFYV